MSFCHIGIKIHLSRIHFTIEILSVLYQAHSQSNSQPLLNTEISCRRAGGFDRQLSGNIYVLLDVCKKKLNRIRISDGWPSALD